MQQMTLESMADIETFKIVVDIRKNRMYVFSKRITTADASRYVAEFLRGAEQLREGWTGMTIMYDSAVLNPEVQEKLQPTLAMAQKNGLSTTKQWPFVANKTIWNLQMRRLFKDAVTPYDTIEEADAYLDAM